MDKAQPKHTITVFLDEDGYTAYFNEFPWISAGDDTEEASIKELGLALETAKQTFSEEEQNKRFSLVKGSISRS